MTAIKRRAVLAAAVGAFINLQGQERKKQEKRTPVFDEALGVFVSNSDAKSVTALSLDVTRENPNFEITGIVVTYDDGGKRKTARISMTELMSALEPHKPVNNECPVCGTIAEPIKKLPKCASLMDDVRNCDLFDHVVNCTRCKNCNAAFWQDAV